MPAGWPGLVLKIGITVWLVTVSAWDRLQRRIPNALVLPVMFGALGWQIWRALFQNEKGVFFALAAWGILFSLWQLHFFGGGDTKLLMALFALFPTARFLLLFCIIVLVVSLPLLAFKYFRRGWREKLRQVHQRARQGQILPTAEDLQREGRPHCWSLALPGVIYLWWLC
ncbi:MAG: prepilin peptidase [Anaerolineae bacterium]|nr:prepilin peptidase [Anaerolineae bacterium]